MHPTADTMLLKFLRGAGRRVIGSVRPNRQRRRGWDYFQKSAANVGVKSTKEVTAPTDYSHPNVEGAEAKSTKEVIAPTDYFRLSAVGVKARITQPAIVHMGSSHPSAGDVGVKITQPVIAHMVSSCPNVGIVGAKTTLPVTARTSVATSITCDIAIAGLTTACTRPATTRLSSSISWAGG